jgi:hypothetical protein
VETSVNTIKKKHITRFRELAQELNGLMLEILEYCPTAELYAEDSWNLNLMKGPTHEGMDGTPQYQNVVANELVRTLGGGGW